MLFRAERGFFMKLETLVKEFLFECEIREYSGMTVENYRKQLRHFTDFLKEQYEIHELEQLKSTHVKAFIKHYQLRQCKPSYVNDNLKAVKVLCAYAYKEKYVDHLITAEIKNVKEPKTLIHTFSREEIKKMISYYHGSNYVDIRNKLILMMLFDTGIRVNELCDLKEAQIQDSYFIIYGKGKKERVVPKKTELLSLFSVGFYQLVKTHAHFPTLLGMTVLCGNKPSLCVFRAWLRLRAFCFPKSARKKMKERGKGRWKKKYWQKVFVEIKPQ